MLMDVQRLQVDYDIYQKLNDLNTRLENIEKWISGLLKDKIEEYDKENDMQNERISKIEYSLITGQKL